MKLCMISTSITSMSRHSNNHRFILTGKENDIGKIRQQRARDVLTLKSKVLQQLVVKILCIMQHLVH